MDFGELFLGFSGTSSGGLENFSRSLHWIWGWQGVKDVVECLWTWVDGIFLLAAKCQFDIQKCRIGAGLGEGFKGKDKFTLVRTLFTLCHYHRTHAVSPISTRLTQIVVF